MNTNPHILVVDDSAAFRELVALRLRALGCSCVIAGSVPEAIDALCHERFDLVLSDHRLPGPSGLELLTYARRRVPDVPFVLMSSAVEPELHAAGAAAVYEKSELLDALSHSRFPAATAMLAA
jgi:CheY-like chemotaxis protein